MNLYLWCLMIFFCSFRLYMNKVACSGVVSRVRCFYGPLLNVTEVNYLNICLINVFYLIFFSIRNVTLNKKLSIIFETYKNIYFFFYNINVKLWMILQHCLFPLLSDSEGRKWIRECFLAIISQAVLFHFLMLPVSK